MASSLSRRQPRSLRRRAKSRSGLRGSAAEYRLRRERRTYRWLKTSYCLLLGAHRTKSPPAKQMERIAAGATPDRNIRGITIVYADYHQRSTVREKVNTLSL
jgi:hypothetical protein